MTADVTGLGALRCLEAIKLVNLIVDSTKLGPQNNLAKLGKFLKMS